MCPFRNYRVTPVQGSTKYRGPFTLFIKFLMHITEVSAAGADYYSINSALTALFQARFVGAAISAMVILEFPFLTIDVSIV